jgi:hypothetical protein
MGLQGMGILAEKASSWIAPLALIGSIFSGVAIFIHGRHYQKMERLGAKIDRIIDISKRGVTTLEHYQAFLKLFEAKMKKNPEILQDCFHFKNQTIGQRLVDIEFLAKKRLASSCLKKQKKGRYLLYKTLKTLRGRINHNMRSSALAGVTSAINVIGSLVFFAGPAMPIGVGISVVGAFLGAAKFLHQRVVDYQVMQKVGFQRKWYEWILS